MSALGMSIGKLSEAELNSTRATLVKSLREAGYGDKAERLAELLEDFSHEYVKVVETFETKLVEEMSTSLADLHATLSMLSEEKT